MFVIKYTPCALNSTGKGEVVYFNEDGAVSREALIDLFNEAQETRQINDVDIYEAQLITVVNGELLRSNSGFVNDTIEKDDELAYAYRLAFKINGASVDASKVEVPSGGGTPAQVLDFVVTLTKAQIEGPNYHVLVAGQGANTITHLIAANFDCTLDTPYTGGGTGFQIVYANDHSNGLLKNPAPDGLLTSGGFQGHQGALGDHRYGEDASGTDPRNQALCLKNLGSAYADGVGSLTIALTVAVHTMP